MSVQRPLLRIAGALAGAVLAISISAPAHAAAPASATAQAGHQVSADRVLKAPPAPSHAKGTVVPATAVSPTVSPSVSTGHIAPNGTYSCGSGNLCALAWDPTTANWKIFYFYNCNDYSLSNWNGTGYYYDNQTGNVTSYFFDDWYIVWLSFTPDRTQHSYNWDPIYTIENC
jgi:hypothetical protein